MTGRIARSVSGAIAIVLLTTLILYPVISRLINQLTVLTENLVESNVETLRVIGSAIAKRDSDTDSHNYRVTIYSVELAECIGLRPNIIQGLIKGAFLHDVGKIRELAYRSKIDYTDEGRLLSHIVIGLSMLDEKLKQVTDFPEGQAQLLKHMIVSHHGEYEFGSPKLPMTLEAVALHYLDNLDAKIHSFEKLMEEDANVDSPWTTYFPNIGRKLFKGES